MVPVRHRSRRDPQGAVLLVGLLLGLVLAPGCREDLPFELTEEQRKNPAVRRSLQAVVSTERERGLSRARLRSIGIRMHEIERECAARFPKGKAESSRCARQRQEQLLAGNGIGPERVTDLWLAAILLRWELTEFTAARKTTPAALQELYAEIMARHDQCARRGRSCSQGEIHGICVRRGFQVADCTKIQYMGLVYRWPIPSRRVIRQQAPPSASSPRK